jgi:hypothetical protein
MRKIFDFYSYFTRFCKKKNICAMLETFISFSYKSGLMFENFFFSKFFKEKKKCSMLPILISYCQRTLTIFDPIFFLSRDSLQLTFLFSYNIISCTVYTLNKLTPFFVFHVTFLRTVEAYIYQINQKQATKLGFN